MSKKTKTEKTLDFLAGKGFYIILIVCVAAIGVSGYMLLFNNSDPAAVDDPGNSYIEWLEPSADIPVLEATPYQAPVDGLPDDEGVLSVLKPTGGINVSPEPPAINPPATSPSPSPAGASPSPSPTPGTSPSPSAAPSEEPSPSPTPKPADKTEPQFFWPVSGEVIVPYAHDELIYSKTMGDWRAHVGIDIAVELGTQVMASADGVVKDIYIDPKLGSCVIIEHSGGMTTMYSNLQEQATVQIDKKVSAGDIIGGVGNTASWESGEDYHLHFEVFKDGMPVNPTDYLPER